MEPAGAALPGPAADAPAGVTLTSPPCTEARVVRGVPVALKRAAIERSNRTHPGTDPLPGQQHSAQWNVIGETVPGALDD